MGTNAIRDLGEAMSAAIERASSSVVQVSAGHGHRRARASGTVWSDTLVVTAAHAVHADEARIRLHDGSERKGVVLGRDLATDLALIEVEGGGLTPIAFADASAVKVGHLAIALGRPGRSVRASLRMVGVIGTDVPTRAGARLARWIETDRGLPDGFSGGPLLDADGLAIGVGTDGLVRAADLAIAREEVERVVAEIRAHGHVRRGWLGVAVNPVRLPKKLADDLGQESGALVIGVEEGGPADAAGMVLGDVIVGIAGAPVRGPDDLVSALRSRIQEALEVRLVRGGVVETLQVTTIARAA